MTTSPSLAIERIPRGCDEVTVSALAEVGAVVHQPGDDFRVSSIDILRTAHADG